MSQPTLEKPAQTLSEPNLYSHLPPLDGLRGLAILGVMLYHMTVLTPHNPLDRAFIVAMDWGGYGVDLFFVLSGFLITGILLDAKPRREGSGFRVQGLEEKYPPSSLNPEPRTPEHYFRNFYARRTLRIFPLYYAVVAFSLLILPHIPNSKSAKFGQITGDEIWYWTYLSNYCIAYRNAWRHGILDLSWTLSIEEQFYLLWPLIVYLASPRTLKRICFGLIATAIATRTTLALICDPHALAPILLTPCKVDSLAIGALLATTFRQTGVTPWLPLAKRLLWIGSLSFLTLYAAGGFKWDGLPMLSLGFTALGITFGSLLTLSLSPFSIQNSSFRILSTPFLRTLGKYSYAMYLFHLPLRALLRDTLYGPTPKGHFHFPTLLGSELPGQLLFYPLAIAFTLAAAMLSYHLFEKHFLKLKRFFPAHA